MSTARPRHFSRHENLQRGDEVLTSHEGNSKAIASQNPSRDSQGAQEVCSKVSCGETRRLTRGEPANNIDSVDAANL